MSDVVVDCLVVLTPCQTGTLCKFYIHVSMSGAAKIMLVGHRLVTLSFFGKLPATRGVWVIIG